VLLELNIAETRFRRPAVMVLPGSCWRNVAMQIAACPSIEYVQHDQIPRKKR